MGSTSAWAYIIETRVPDGFASCAVQRRLEETLPTVRIKTMGRFPGSWWERHRRDIAIGIGVGLTVAPIAEPVRPLAAHLREALG